jgi:DNA gyrase/topoisomerase IV subunit A
LPPNRLAGTAAAASALVTSTARRELRDLLLCCFDTLRGMVEDDRQSENARQLQVLEAKLVAATRAHEVIAIAQQAPSSKLAVPQVMQAFSLNEEQAAAVLDSQFRGVTVAAREQIEAEIRTLKG